MFWPAKTSVPNGYKVGEALVSARTSGGMSSYTRASAALTAAATLVAGRNMVANSTVTLTVSNATASLIISMSATRAITISGTGTLAGAAALVTNGTLSLVGTASIGAIASKSATGTISFSGSSGMTALAHLETDPNPSTTMTEATITNAILTALLTDYSDTGNVAEGIQNASSAGNPWSALIDDNNDAGTFGERVQKLLTVAKFLGLK
jgi:hypothetical protein